MKEKIQKILMSKQKGKMDRVYQVISSYLVGKYFFKSITDESRDKIYVYQDGIYEGNGKDIIKKEVEDILGEICKTSFVNEIINKVVRMTIIDRKDFDCKDLNLIPLLNGVYDLKEDKFTSYKPNMNFTYRLPIKYDKNARCNKIDEFFNEVLFEDDIDVMYEWFAYHLYREYFLKKAVLLVGPPNSAKSVIMNLMSKFIGEENVCSVGLHEIGKPFTVSDFYKKHANLKDELSSKEIGDVESFKLLIGRSILRGEFKYGNSFNFVNYAKLTYATNQVPKLPTGIDEKSFYDRWIVFECEQSFAPDNPKTNPFLIDELTSEKELSGLFNDVIWHLKKIIKSKNFSYKKTFDEVKEVMEKYSDSTLRFLKECCVRGEYEDWLSKDELWRKYIEFCDLNGLSQKNNKYVFGKNVNEFCDYVMNSRENSGMIEGWRYIKVGRLLLKGM
jgi:putative DNA primase/helicase